jgi:hypothetical protein
MYLIITGSQKIQFIEEENYFEDSVIIEYQFSADDIQSLMMVCRRVIE